MIVSEAIHERLRRLRQGVVSPVRVPQWCVCHSVYVYEDRINVGCAILLNKEDDGFIREVVEKDILKAVIQGGGFFWNDEIAKLRDEGGGGIGV